MNTDRTRRQYMALSTAALAGVAGCTADSTEDEENGGDDSTEEGNGGGSNTTNWDHNETYTEGGENLQNVFIDELEEGDEIKVEVVVNHGTRTRFSLINQDSGEVPYDRLVFRSDKLDQYDPDDDLHVVSPFTDTITISEFGEYDAQVSTMAPNLEVELRFKVL